ncbi:MAG: hypothetical protein F6J93_05750 [Oscillatoria sp. SIO1A7]|nr:hypothetical protein [Oscillatoria sp. SIO1A7]
MNSFAIWLNAQFADAQCPMPPMPNARSPMRNANIDAILFLYQIFLLIFKFNSILI